MAQGITKKQAWIIASRPKTLPAAVGPVLVGTALAISQDQFGFVEALAALFVAMLLQIGVNLANDYFDYVKGVDTEERLGPTRVAASGLISLFELRLGIGSTLFIAALIGLYLISIGGLPVILIGIASILSALAYSGGPFPLASNGLGDLFVFIFFGLVAVMGTYYVQSLEFTMLAFVVSVPVGALITAILVINNLRDIHTDSKTGKRTLAVMIGQRAARTEYVLLMLVAYCVPVGLLVNGTFAISILLPLLSVPLALAQIRSIYALQPSPAMNVLLAQTARLSLVFSVLFAIGIVFG